MAIILKGILSIPFLKRSRFTGSCKNMNYIIEHGLTETGKAELKAIVWQGPYNFMTSTEIKTEAVFSFDEEGMKQVEVWLNEQYDTKFK